MYDSNDTSYVDVGLVKEFPTIIIIMIITTTIKILHLTHLKNVILINWQALSLSTLFSLSLSLRERERADTLITFHTTTPTENFLSDLYSSVIHHWNCQLKPYLFQLRKYMVN